MMFNPFKKKEAQPESQPTQSPLRSEQYPKEVMEIHREFHTSGDRLLCEANGLLSKELPEMGKGKRLISIGFTQAQQAKEAGDIIKHIEMTKEVAGYIRHYQYYYPNNKFITEEEVKRICRKYNLVCGEVSRYKGFVPEKNLDQISNFKLRDADRIMLYSYGSSFYREETLKSRRITSRTMWEDHPEKYQSFKNGGVEVLGGGYPRCKYEYNNLRICAPVKDMDTTGMTIEGGYRLIEIPDPIVLQPVRGGYLIISAWGNEASDPIVVNQKHN